MADKTHAAHQQPPAALRLCDAGGPGSRQSWPISFKQDMFIKVPIKTQELWQGLASWKWAFWRSLFHLGAGVGCNKPCISSAEEKEMFCMAGQKGHIRQVTLVGDWEARKRAVTHGEKTSGLRDIWETKAENLLPLNPADCNIFTDEGTTTGTLV